MNKVFVIIVTYNGKQWYDRCFESLRTSALPLEVVVVDNASTDDTVSYIRSTFPEVLMIESEVNLGFGQGNNKGMRYALEHGADYVFLLNQDAWIEVDTLSKLVDIHKSNADFGVLSPMHLNAAKTQIEKCLMGHLSYFEHINLNLFSDFYMGTLKDVYDVREVNAAAWLLPRTTLETVGGFDPLFFHYGEDDNYLSRVLYHGYRIGLVPSATICHDTERRIEKSVKQQSTFDKWLLQRAADIMYPQSIEQQIMSYYKEAFRKMVFGNFKNAMSNLRFARYLSQNKKKIAQSILQNKIKARNWL